MATGATGRGRPRQAKKWESTMRYDLFVPFATHPDVHTALFMAGAAAPDLLITAMREHIARHALPAGVAEVQTQAALAGLGMVGAVDPSGAGKEVAAATGQAPCAPVAMPAPPPAAMIAPSASPSARFAQSQLDDA
jgi:hypothetical protein